MFKEYVIDAYHVNKPSLKSCITWTPLSVPKEPWIDIFKVLVLGLPRSKKGKDSTNIKYLFFRKIVWLHGVPMNTVSDKYV